MKEITYSARAEYYTACRNCKKRCEGCHDGCDEYAKEVILGIVLGELFKKEANLKSDTDEYIINRTIDRKMSKHPDNRYGRRTCRRSGTKRRR